MKGSKLIFKLAPGDETRRETFHARECFLREIYIYEVVRNNGLFFFSKFFIVNWLGKVILKKPNTCGV